MASLSIDTTLDLCTRHGTLVAQADCQLGIEYWEGGSDGLWDWCVESVYFEPTSWNKAETITKETDPDMWPIILRAVNADRASLDEKVQEAIDIERPSWSLELRADYHASVL